MRVTIDETKRRRDIQQKFNEEHNITPKQIEKKIVDVMEVALTQTSAFKVPEEKRERPISFKEWDKRRQKLNAKDLSARIDELEEQMLKLASELKFEEAASVRDEMQALQQELLLMPGRDIN